MIELQCPSCDQPVSLSDEQEHVIFSWDWLRCSHCGETVVVKLEAHPNLVIATDDEIKVAV